MSRPLFLASGRDSAWNIGRIYARNVQDLLDKYDDGSSGYFERGFLHTSTGPAPGTNYYHDVWSRDGGRGLIELACLGYTTQAAEVARYFCRHLNAGNHWARTIQHPANPDAPDSLELDGNALALLGVYNAWRVNGRSRELAEEFLPTCRAVLEWAREQAQASPYGSLLPCISELTGNPRGPYPVYGVFPNVGMVVALRACAELASCAQDAATVQAMLTLADQVAQSVLQWLVSREGIRTCVPRGVWMNGLDGRDGAPYDNAEWEGHGFPVFHWTRQLPFVLWSDAFGFDLRSSLNLEVDLRSLNYLLGEMNKGRFFRRYGFVSNTAWTGMANRHDDTMAGYGQGFFTQACLVADCVNAYSLCLEGYARLAYDGEVCEPLTYERDPWILHECFHYEHYEDGRDHTFGRLCGHEPGGLDNPGDEGNLVQMAEGLKVFRLVAGVDDFTPGRLRLMPRLPWGWDGLELDNYPIAGAARQGRLRCRIINDLARGGASLSYESDIPDMDVSIRLGPLPRSARPAAGRSEENAWGRWVWFDGLRGDKGSVQLRV